LRGDQRTADAALEAFLEELRKPESQSVADSWLSGYLAALGRVRLLQGRIAEARLAEQRIRAVENLREWPIAPVSRALLRGLLFDAEGNTIGAEIALREAVRLQERIRIEPFAGNARVPLAALLIRTGREDEALEVFRPLLEEHEKHGTPGALVLEGPLATAPLRLARERHVSEAFATQVLRLLGETIPDDAAVVTPSGEPLTAREIEVLRLIAAGARNATIADCLGISVHTVKRHVANLLQKLGAASRAEAGAMARRLRVE